MLRKVALQGHPPLHIQNSPPQRGEEKAHSRLPPPTTRAAPSRTSAHRLIPSTGPHGGHTDPPEPHYVSVQLHPPTPCYTQGENNRFTKIGGTGPGSGHCVTCRRHDRPGQAINTSGLRTNHDKLPFVLQNEGLQTAYPLIRGRFSGRGATFLATPHETHTPGA